MTILLFRGITKKGRELIKTHGRSWTILETRQSVHFSTNKGPWHLCIPSSMKEDSIEKKIHHSRWINGIGDINFIIDQKL